MNQSLDLLASKLPSELILDIFTRLLEPEHRMEWTEYYPPKTVTTPLLLGKICKAWRQIVWGTPDLWSTITLTLHPIHYHTQAELLKQWLLRCRNRPLTIAIRGQGGDEDEYWEAYPPREVFRQLAAVSPWWRDVDTIIPYPCYSDLAIIHDHLPRLESITIRPPDGVDAMFDYGLDFLRVAPSLRDLTLSGVYYSDATMLPWDQLSTLSCQDFCIDDCYAMLQNSLSLTDCRFDSIHQPSDFAYPAQTAIHLANLRTLELSSIGNMVATAFLYSLELPSLTDLTLSLGFSFDDRESFTMSSVTSLIGRSGCSTTLERLTIVNLRLVEQELVDCLACTPALKELHLQVEYPKSFPGMFISDTFLAALSLPSMRQPEVSSILPFDRPLLPNLKVLEYSGPVHITGRALQILLEFRGQRRMPAPSAITSLERVVMESTSPVRLSPEVQKSLRGLKYQGMDLLLTNGFTSWIQDDWFSTPSSPRPAVGTDTQHAEDSRIFTDDHKSAIVQSGLPFPAQASNMRSSSTAGKSRQGTMINMVNSEGANLPRRE